MWVVTGSTASYTTPRWPRSKNGWTPSVPPEMRSDTLKTIEVGKLPRQTTPGRGCLNELAERCHIHPRLEQEGRGARGRSALQPGRRPDRQEEVCRGGGLQCHHGEPLHQDLGRPGRPGVCRLYQ